MTKEDFIKRVHEVKKTWADSRFDDYVNYVVDNKLIDLDKYLDNYAAAFPVLASFFEIVAKECVGNTYDTYGLRRRRKANFIKRHFCFSFTTCK